MHNFIIFIFTFIFNIERLLKTEKKKIYRVSSKIIRFFNIPVYFGRTLKQPATTPERHLRSRDN